MLKSKSSVIVAFMFCVAGAIQPAFAQSNAGSNAPATPGVPATSNSTAHSIKTESSKKSVVFAGTHKSVGTTYKHSQITNPPGAQPGMGSGMGKASGTAVGN